MMEVSSIAVILLVAVANGYDVQINYAPIAAYYIPGFTSLGSPSQAPQTLLNVNYIYASNTPAYQTTYQDGSTNPSNLVRGYQENNMQYTNSYINVEDINLGQNGNAIYTKTHQQVYGSSHANDNEISNQGYQENIYDYQSNIQTTNQYQANKPMDYQDGHQDVYQGSSQRRPQRLQGSRAQRGQKSGQLYGPGRNVHVPVVIKRKQKKKSSIFTVIQGQYIPGGLQIYGKFKDLETCQKACEMTPNCFSGDFSPHANRCYMHTNTTACSSTRTHPSITHFKRVPCTVTNTPRGRVTLGAHAFNGVKLTGINTLQACITKCANMGGGIAGTFNSVPTTPQLCFAVDFDFSTHTCYVHVHTTSEDAPLPILLIIPAPFPLPKGYQAYCPKTGAVGTPGTLAPDPNSVNIVMCPKN